MSSNVRVNTRLAAACQEVARQRLQLPALATLDLSGLQTALTETQRIDLPALGQLVSSAPVRLTLGALAPDAFGTIGQLVTRERNGVSPETLAVPARAALDAALATASTAIGAATRDITTEAFTEAGRELGYTVAVCRGDSATGIELRRGHEIVLMRVENDGAVESDHAGLADSTCGDHQRELEEAAARRGVVITRREEHHHFSAGGGGLIQAAGARRDSSLARAVALMPRPGTPAPAGGRRTWAAEPERRQSDRRAR